MTLSVAQKDLIAKILEFYLIDIYDASNTKAELTRQAKELDQQIATGLDQQTELKEQAEELRQTIQQMPTKLK